jgi:hypothetical protein
MTNPSPGDPSAARSSIATGVRLARGGVAVALVAGGLLTATPAHAQSWPPPPQTVPSIGLSSPRAYAPATVPSIGLSTPPPYEVPSIGLHSLQAYPPLTAPSIGSSTPRPYDVPSIGLTTPQAFPPSTVPSTGLQTPPALRPLTVP